MDLYIHPPGRLHRVVIDQLSKGTTLPVFENPRPIFGLTR
jgi:hypothetical protein